MTLRLKMALHEAVASVANDATAANHCPAALSDRISPSVVPGVFLQCLMNWMLLLLQTMIILAPTYNRA